MFWQRHPPQVQPASSTRQGSQMLDPTTLCVNPQALQDQCGDPNFCEITSSGADTNSSRLSLDSISAMHSRGTINFKTAEQLSKYDCNNSRSRAVREAPCAADHVKNNCTYLASVISGIFENAGQRYNLKSKWLNQNTKQKGTGLQHNFNQPVTNFFSPNFGTEL